MFSQYTDVNTRSLFAQPIFLTPIVYLDIFALPDHVRDCFLLSQHPNHFLRRSELSLFGTAPDVFDDEDTDLISCRYYSIGTKYLILIDGRLVNFCNDIQFKHFKISFPELKSEKWYHVVK